MQYSSARSISLFSVISYVFVGIALFLSASVFLYRAYLLRSINSMDTALASARKSFEPEFVEAAARLDLRLKSASVLMSGHDSLSPLFDLLEKKTLESVRFTTFNFNRYPTGGGLLRMGGLAKSFNAVALQSDVFASESYLKNPVFSDFALDENGSVLFDFSADVDEELLKYRAPAESAIGEGGSSATSTEEEF